MIDVGKDKTTLAGVYPVSISEIDRQYNLKPAVLFNYMQDLAAKSITYYDEKYSWDELYKKGFGWFLIRYRVEFDAYPNRISDILIHTESRGCQRLNAYRDFEAFNKLTGKRLLRAVSSWMIVDLENKAVQNIQSAYPDFPCFEKREDDLELCKLRQIDRVDCEKLFHVRYDDLDINNHVNNKVYITWAMEVLDYEFRASHIMKTIDIYFKHDVQYGEDIVSQVKYDKENLITEHVIKNVSTDQELCFIKVQYSKI